MEIEQKSVGGVAIRFLSGPLVEKTITILKPVTIIGRDPQSDIVVFDPRVSRRHACIRKVNDFVEHRKSITIQLYYY